jgi:hypothetical protein
MVFCEGCAVISTKKFSKNTYFAIIGPIIGKFGLLRPFDRPFEGSFSQFQGFLVNRIRSMTDFKA